MPETLHKRIISRGVADTTPIGGCSFKKPQRKQVSYNKNEDYITKFEQKLMQRYRCNYSALHKRLIVKAAQQEFSDFVTPFF